MGRALDAFATGIADLVTFGGYSKSLERKKQEELNKLQMQREDSTYQRTVEDMNKAGLNPLSMSGTNSAQPLTNPIKSENNTFDKAMQLGTMISSVATGIAQAKNLNASTAGMGIANAMAQKDLDNLNKLGLSPSEYAHKNQKELADLSKGFWGRIGNDLYDNVGGKINELLEKGTNIVNEGIESLGKGEFKEAVNNVVDDVVDKGADKLAEKTVLGKGAKKVGEWRKNIQLSGAYQMMQYAQQEINYWSKVPTQENLKKVNDYRIMYEEAEKELKKEYGKHWRDYL